MPIRKSSVSGGGIASGTTADRPATPSIGDQFYNGTLGVLEIYTTSGWLPATGANDFNIVLTGSETSVTLDKEYFSGAYTITSALADNSFDLYLFDTSNNSAGYTNTPSVNATSNFNKVVVYGGTNGDLLSFAYKTTFTTQPSTSDTFAAPYIVSIDNADLPRIDDSVTITGGNFDTDIQVWFDGQNGYSQQAKSVVYGSSTSIVAVRPDNLLQDNSPYTLRLVKPGLSEAFGSGKNTLVNSVTAGSNPVWTTASGLLDTAFPSAQYSKFVEATDPDGGSISYQLASGQLPDGMSLNSVTGEISGITSTQSSQFVLSAIDESGNITNRSFQINLMSATGGSISDINGYRMHVFTSSGTFYISEPVSADILVVGGGGSGGGDNAGGAGAGGLVFSEAQSLSSSSYIITIGAGGPGRPINPSTPPGANGSNSVAFSKTALGGGGGGAQSFSAPSGGGSGGGGSWDSSPGAAYQPSSASGGFGNAGGAGSKPNTQGPGGGGGGAGQAGSAAVSNSPGNGGNGLDYSSYFGSSVGQNGYFAGGGGGAANNSEFGGLPTYTDAGLGGLGGGGKYGGVTGWYGDSGMANTGGGGAGAAYDGTNVGASGAGGSGIVIVRYPI